MQSICESLRFSSVMRLNAPQLAIVMATTSVQAHHHLAPEKAFLLVLASDSSFKRGNAFKMKVSQIIAVLYSKLSIAFRCIWNKIPTPCTAHRQGLPAWV